MTKCPPALLILIAFASAVGPSQAESERATDDTARLQALDAYWAEVSRAVREGDFEGYRSTCHTEGVFVSGVSRKTQPLSEAFAHWKKEFDNTKAGRMTANVQFRFSQRIGNRTTAHETGIFLYTMVDAQGKKAADHIDFEALLVKKNGKWKILMEYQKSRATLKDWKELSKE